MVAKPKEQKTKAITPAEPVSRHDALKKAERIAREAFATIKQTDPAKGGDLSRSATTAFLKADLDALRGDKIVSGAQRGHERVHGTKDEKQRRWDIYQDEVNTLCESHSNWSWSRIKGQAVKNLKAKNMTCCERTIQRHCRDPRKKT